MTQGLTRLFLASAALLLIAAPAFAEEENGTITEAIKNGTPNVDLRYRFEGVDEDGIAEDASASTIRLRIGYRTGTWRGWQAFGELEGVNAVGSRWPVAAAFSWMRSASCRWRFSQRFSGCWKREHSNGSVGEKP